MKIEHSSWHDTNFQYLLSQVDEVRQLLLQKIEPKPDRSIPVNFSSNLALKTMDGVMRLPSALEQLCAIFMLSAFERDLLLLCVGIELYPVFGSLCAAIQGNEDQDYPTFRLAFDLFDRSDLGILSSQSPLQYWKLIEIGLGQSLTSSPIRIDKRILCYLLGEPCWDDKLVGIVKPIQTATDNNTLLPPSHQVLVDSIVATCFGTSQPNGSPVTQLCSTDVALKRSIAAAACNSVGYNLNAISASVLPSHPNELHHLQQLWNREALLTKSALLLECDWVTQADTVQENTISRFIQGIYSPLVVSRQERQSSSGQRPTIAFDVPQLSHSDQLDIWQSQLSAIATDLNGYVEKLVAQFNLKTDAIATVCAAVKSQEVGSSLVCSSPEVTFDRLWNLCRTMARPQLDNLAQRIESKATWNDVVLPEQQQQTLHEIAAHVQYRDRVYWQWGFADKGSRGLGISVLFEGPPGTGKTTAAELLAKELQLDLYRIDLSQVVDKYIGETEKHLRRIFDAAEAGGVILLFDEADALFGKRTEVKDSHDHHANVQVNYLLQRMEAYQGLAILTTNLKSSLDQAFLRRLRFVVSFPFPDFNLRIQIWKHSFPKRVQTHGLAFDKLARLNSTGGDIRNIVLLACFLAAQTTEQVVTMEHILSATKSEYSKKGKTLTSAEIEGWV
ncbi:MAG: ATP-dependent zinc metalloprotease FtsH [Chroococcidiopsis cubana SAG 39.79]|uniref:ATPase n=2 Tax=Chroococcidiopsis TaxID=54298 RepID=A0AB37UIK6_9CYAN|nr:ATP-binding protein [Chroococcidiopsis cubana]MDZ4877436.1 ATP-dependent zinc metalloprotease FtsH [Chroococcidiopsis cubana SAG 39.79]RUT11227.1 ATPase [Chroococcidiopsis cubana SAG 39.79]